MVPFKYYIDNDSNNSYARALGRLVALRNFFMRSFAFVLFLSSSYSPSVSWRKFAFLSSFCSLTFAASMPFPSSSDGHFCTLVQPSIHLCTPIVLVYLGVLFSAASCLIANSAMGQRSNETDFHSVIGIFTITPVSFLVLLHDGPLARTLTHSLAPGDNVILVYPVL